MFVVASRVVVVIAALLWWAWAFRAWPRIWGAPRTAYENIVYRQGARGFGGLLWLSTGLLLPLYRAWQEHEGSTGLLLRLLISVVLLPFSFWGGYWFGRAMAATAGVKNRPPAV